MKAVAFLTEPVMIDRILGHRDAAGLASPFELRGSSSAG
jgi:hypothetical protein